MEFCKYQGTGNDFVIVDGMAGGVDFDSGRIAEICDRHFGVGADGFIAAVPSEAADVKMAFYNSDGSEASMCGNGIRCFSKFVRDHGIVKKDAFTVETGDGIKHIEMIEEASKVSVVKVDMGTYSDFREEDSPKFGKAYAAHLGVPHAVLFKETGGRHMEALSEAAMKLGHDIEFAPEFQPERTNVNFVEVLGSDHILCSTWERGAGKTLACGTGACSSAAAARLFRGCGDKIRVTMPGGEVVVSFGDPAVGDGPEADRAVFMEGPAVLAFSGSVAEEA